MTINGVKSSCNVVFSYDVSGDDIDMLSKAELLLECKLSSISGGNSSSRYMALWWLLLRNSALVSWVGHHLIIGSWNASVS